MSISTSTVPAEGSLTNSIGRYRWLICSLLFLATTINYIDRQVLALIKGTLDTELGWTNTQFGWTNAAFQLAYAASLFIFGWFVDRKGVKIGYAVSIAAWSLAAAAPRAGRQRERIHRRARRARPRRGRKLSVVDQGGRPLVSQAGARLRHRAVQFGRQRRRDRRARDRSRHRCGAGVGGQRSS